MCAASVYPEPGSNSHIIFLKINFVLFCQTSWKFAQYTFSIISPIFIRFPHTTRFFSEIFFWVIRLIIFSGPFFIDSFLYLLIGYFLKGLLFTFQCTFFFLFSLRENVSYFNIFNINCQHFFETFFILFFCLIFLFIFALKKCKIIN